MQLPFSMGRPAVWNDVVAIDLTSPMPALTYFGFLTIAPTAFSTFWTLGSLNGILCWTHWSYTSGPYMRSMTSSIQSVSGQPVAVPDSMPTHHGLGPSAAILSESWSICCHVVGTV